MEPLERGTTGNQLRFHSASVSLLVRPTVLHAALAALDESRGLGGDGPTSSFLLSVSAGQSLSDRSPSPGFSYLEAVHWIFLRAPGSCVSRVIMSVPACEWCPLGILPSMVPS